MTFQNHTLRSLPPNLVLFLWFLPWMPELKPELSSCTSPFQVVSVNSSSPSTVAPCFCFLLKQNLSEELCLPHLYVLTSHSLLSRLRSGCHTHSPGRGHRILLLSSTDTPHTPSFWEAFLSWPPQHLILLVLSSLLRLLFSLFLFPSWISKIWNDARLRSWSSSIYLCSHCDWWYPSMLFKIPSTSWWL